MAQMPAHGGLADAEHFLELGDREFLDPQQRDDSQAGRVPEGTEEIGARHRDFDLSQDGRVRPLARYTGSTFASIDRMAVRRKRKKKPVRRFNWGLLVFAVVVGAMAAFALRKPSPPVSGPELNDVKDLADFKTFNKVQGGWIAVLSPAWTGAKDPAAVEHLCKGLTDRLHPAAGETIDLLAPTGEPLRNCQASR